MTAEDAWCPYCDKTRVYGEKGDLRVTCGSVECVTKARLGGRKPAAPPVIGQYPWSVRHEIDFQNGFASQNLTDRARKRA